MDLNLLQKQLQDWTNRVPLVILGSGASVPFKLPSMRTLGDHLKKKITLVDKDDKAQFEEFKIIFDKVQDLEATLLQLQVRPNVLQAIIVETWKLVNKYDLEAYDQILNEKVDFPLAELTTYLLSTAQKKLSIITTNYDRLAEYAASLSSAFICTGYAQNFFGHFSKHIHPQELNKLQGFNGQVNIWKVHGSLDWFKTKEDLDIHLPLRQTIPADKVPSIVTPGNSKFEATHLEPFRTILTEADTAIEKANGYLCIGYGFNDHHVQPKLITQIKSGKSIIVITKELSLKTKQSIIDNKCKQYMLIEQANTKDTRIFSSNFTGEKIIPDVSYWALGEYLKLIKS
jgi:hypothetical protein